MSIKARTPFLAKQSQRYHIKGNAFAVPVAPHSLGGYVMNQRDSGELQFLQQIESKHHFANPVSQRHSPILNQDRG